MLPRLIGLLLLVTGSFLVAIPYRLFPVCFYASGNMKARMMSCFATGNVTAGIGIITLVAAAAFLFFPRSRRAAAAVAGAAALALFFVYLVQPGVCAAPAMACRIGTLPAVTVAATVQLILAVAGSLLRRPPRDS